MTGAIDPKEAERVLRQWRDTAPGFRHMLERLEWRIAHNAGLCSRERKPRWRHVKDATGLGSTSAQDLCSRHGVEPDEEIGGDNGTD